LDDPALDPHIENPTEQMATQMRGQQMNQDQQKALQALAAQNGILFFYRGGNPMDELMCKVMQQFVSIYHIALIPVTVDGQVSAAFPKSRQDEGQSNKLGIAYFPAIILVNPSTGAIQPVAYGFLSQDELLKRFLLIAHHFKPTYLGGT
jgi:conjugal transfer pilus assembly protein TraF